MAHIMGMQVIAEGVETPKKFYTCKDIGADFIQGYLYKDQLLKIKDKTSTYLNIVSLIMKIKEQMEHQLLVKSLLNQSHLNINTSLYDLFVHFKK